MSKGSKVTNIAIIAIGLPVALFAGTMAMNSVCTGNVQDQEWLKKLNDLCLWFTQLTNFIEEFSTKN